MKVIVTNGLGWYSDRVGEIFNVKNFSHSMYIVNREPMIDIKIVEPIRKKDCKIIESATFYRCPVCQNLFNKHQLSQHFKSTHLK